MWCLRWRYVRLGSQGLMRVCKPTYVRLNLFMSRGVRVGMRGIHVRERALRDADAERGEKS